MHQISVSGLMPQVLHKHVASNRGKWVIIALAAALVVGILAGVIWLSLRAADSRDFEAAKQRLDQARASRSFEIGVYAMDGYINGGWYRTHRYEAYLLKGSMFEMQKDYSQALLAYREAERYDSEAQGAEYEAIARVSEQNGDTSTAIAYYQKTLDRVPDNAPAATATRNWYKAKIQKLQESKP